MKYNFEWGVFTRPSDAISVYRGSIRIAKGVYDYLGKPSKIAVGFDVANKAVGFRNGNDDGYVVHAAKGCHTIHSQPLCTRIRQMLATDKNDFKFIATYEQNVAVIGGGTK